MPPQITEMILKIPINQILPSAHQARKTFNQPAIQALAESMDHEGLIHPIIVRVAPSPKFQLQMSKNPKEFFDNVELATCSFELISGERRLRAAKFLGWETIPARVISVISEGEAAAKSLVENLQRENLDPIEEAEGFSQLNQVDPVYWTQERIAQISGKDRTYVTRSIGLLNLPEPIKENVRRSTLSRGHAIELLRLPNPEIQLQVAKKIENRTVQQTRQVIDRFLGAKDEASKDQKLIQKSAQMAKEIARQEGLGQTDPLHENWVHLSKAASSFVPIDWKTFYAGNWTWQFNLNLSKLWAMTAAPVSVSTPELEKKRISELRRTLVEWFDRVAQELKQLDETPQETRPSQKP
ncbi:MAG: ParB/RepB/Spo0J family partition protein [Elusimicrobiota bacterium]|jgi:ParB family chromosome partitioning protein